jgi:hypothetical protein
MLESFHQDFKLIHFNVFRLERFNQVNERIHLKGTFEMISPSRQFDAFKSL